MFKAKYDVTGFRLPGEETEQVEVYDHCDEIRKKINAVLRDPDMTRAAFCREISKTLPGRKGDNSDSLQGSTLASFLSKRGPREGRKSLIFYAAYVFFEKLRIRDGKPKSSLRLDMEDAWVGRGGFDITSNETGYLVTKGSYVYTNELGHVQVGKDWRASALR